MTLTLWRHPDCFRVLCPLCGRKFVGFGYYDKVCYICDNVRPDGQQLGAVGGDRHQLGGRPVRRDRRRGLAPLSVATDAQGGGLARSAADLSVATDTNPLDGR